MNIDMLNTFLDLISTRNFNRTANNLMITQSTVSGRVRALEDELGVRLFVRGRGGAELTPEGVRFQNYATNICQGWNQACHDLAMPAGYRGRLRVAMQVSLWDILVNDWIAELRRVMPDIAIHVESDYSEAMIDAIVFGNLDIGVIYTPQYRSELTVEHLFDEQFIMISSQPSCALTDLRAEEYLFVASSPYFKARHGELLPDLRHAPLSMGLSNMCINYLRAHGGAAYLPRRMCQPLIHSGEFFSVDGAPVIHQPVFVVYLSKNRMLPVVTRGLELLAVVDLNAASIKKND